MIKLYDLLEKIKQKPGLYIGRANISDLFMFLVGYKCAIREMKIDLSDQEKDFFEFQPWVQKKYQISTEASWAKIILLFAGDEERAFEVFFQLLEEFKSRHPQIFVEQSAVKAMTVEALQ